MGLEFEELTEDIIAAAIEHFAIVRSYLNVQEIQII